MAYLPFVSADRQTVLGHYSAYSKTGNIAATLGAAAHLSRIRWSPTLSNVYCVLLRLRAGRTQVTAATTAVQEAYQAVKVTAFTTDFSAAITNTNMAGTAIAAATNAMRKTMGASLMGTSGPGYATTAPMSGQTMTADALPFCGCSFTNPSTTLGAAAVTNQVGVGVPMATLYERGADGFHPQVLSVNEGIVVQNVYAGNTDGTFNVHVEWTWVEVFVF